MIIAEQLYLNCIMVAVNEVFVALACLNCCFSHNKVKFYFRPCMNFNFAVSWVLCNCSSISAVTGLLFHLETPLSALYWQTVWPFLVRGQIHFLGNINIILFHLLHYPPQALTREMQDPKVLFHGRCTELSNAWTFSTLSMLYYFLMPACSFRDV